MGLKTLPAQAQFECDRCGVLELQSSYATPDDWAELVLKCNDEAKLRFFCGECKSVVLHTLNEYWTQKCLI